MPNNKLLGPKFGARFPRVRAALAEVVDPAAAVATLRAGQSLRSTWTRQRRSCCRKKCWSTRCPAPGFAVAAEGAVVVALDTTLTPELRAEGLAREVVRRIQDLRKSAGFDIADRVITYYASSPGLSDAIVGFASYIKAETLSVDLRSGELPAGTPTAEDKFDGETLTLALVKAPPTADDAQLAGAVFRAAFFAPGGAVEAPAPSDLELEAEDQLIVAEAAVSSTAAGVMQPALAPLAAPVPAPRKRAAKKTAAKKTGAKKTTAKKAAAKKAGTKKAAAKKAGAKKTAAKQASAKKGRSEEDREQAAYSRESFSEESSGEEAGAQDHAPEVSGGARSNPDLPGRHLGA